MTKHNVVIAYDQPEGDDFAAWLLAQGHTATIGRDTCGLIDGVRTVEDARASDILRALWTAYQGA